MCVGGWGVFSHPELQCMHWSWPCCMANSAGHDDQTRSRAWGQGGDRLVLVQGWPHHGPRWHQAMSIVRPTGEGRHWVQAAQLHLHLRQHRVVLWVPRLPGALLPPLLCPSAAWSLWQLSPCPLPALPRLPDTLMGRPGSPESTCPACCFPPGEPLDPTDEGLSSWLEELSSESLSLETTLPLAQVKERPVPTLPASSTAASLCQGCEGTSPALLLLFRGVMYLGSPL